MPTDPQTPNPETRDPASAWNAPFVARCMERFGMPRERALEFARLAIEGLAPGKRLSQDPQKIDARIDRMLDAFENGDELELVTPEGKEPAGLLHVAEGTWDVHNLAVHDSNGRIELRYDYADDADMSDPDAVDAWGQDVFVDDSGKRWPLSAMTLRVRSWPELKLMVPTTDRPLPNDDAGDVLQSFLEVGGKAGSRQIPRAFEIADRAMGELLRDHCSPAEGREGDSRDFFAPADLDGRIATTMDHACGEVREALDWLASRGHAEVVWMTNGLPLIAVNPELGLLERCVEESKPVAPAPRG